MDQISIEKYDLAKHFKRGIAFRISNAGCCWGNEPQAVTDGYKWANDHLSEIVHNAVNEYVGDLGHDPMGFLKLQTSSIPDE